MFDALKVTSPNPLKKRILFIKHMKNTDTLNVAASSAVRRTGLPNRSRIELKDLRLVSAIAAFGSVTRAAQKLHSSQSALSHQLISLERNLDTRLFDRVGRAMVPTAAGLELIRGAQRILPELASIETAITRRDQARTRPLRIATGCYTCYQWLPDVLKIFTGMHPDIEVEIILEATRRVTDALSENELDFAITAMPPAQESFTKKKLFSDPFVAVVSATHRLASCQAGIQWNELAQETILTHDMSVEDANKLKDAIHFGTAKSGSVAASRIRLVPFTEAIVELARSGLGVGILSQWTARNYADRGDLVLVPLLPQSKRMFYATWRRTNPLRLPFADFAELIRSHQQPRRKG
jgi:LysR family transcriptional regulator for metE and metH